MKTSHKLVVFISVLLFSVSLMSVAINILGDITKVEFSMELVSEPTNSVSGQTEEKPGEKVEVEVSASPGGEMFPLFEIWNPPQTTYFRRLVADYYVNGSWKLPVNYTSQLYFGRHLSPDVTEYESSFPVTFTVRPFVNMTGYLPATVNVNQIEFEERLDYFPDLELFSSPNYFTSSYNVSYTNYKFSLENYRGSEVVISEENLPVPEGFQEQLEELASEVTHGYNTTWDKLKMLEAHLRENYEYDEDFNKTLEMDPMEWFLFHDRRGICSHFNTAFVLLARSIGVPARVAMGYIISPDSYYQVVMPSKAHLWAEVQFDGLGWITFDATPAQEEEYTRMSTYTDITWNDPVALKGGSFQVVGTVDALNGSPVDGVQVEVFLTLSKNETGVVCGRGMVREGIFNITCEVDPALPVNDYQLVAHSLANADYYESWSDPPIRIVAETETAIQAPEMAYVGETVTIVGTLIDKSNGEPIPNAMITLSVDNSTRYFTTDGAGTVSLTEAYQTEGNRTINIEMLSTDYYLGSNSSFGIAIIMPPPRRPNILEMLTIFPYNVMVVASASVIVGAAILLTRKKREAMDLEAGLRRFEGPEPEFPTSYTDYKDGIVKLFNYFFAISKRRFEGIEDSMTPREFQYEILRNVPPEGTNALEYLVTAFEIADYSTSRPKKEEHDKCVAAVELLMELIKNE